MYLYVYNTYLDTHAGGDDKKEEKKAEPPSEKQEEQAMEGLASLFG